MRKARLSDRQWIVVGFVIGALGLAVLFGSPALSGAAPPIPVVTSCGCTCGNRTSMQVTFITDKSCSIYNGQTCYCDGQTCYWKYNAGAMYKSVLHACNKTLPMKQAEPPTNVPPGVVKPPVVAPGQGPAVR